MNIVFLVSSLDGGGAERVATNLCNAWAEQGHLVTLIATFSGGGVSFYPLRTDVELIFLADLVNTRRKTLATYFHRLITLRRAILQREVGVVVSFLSNVNVAAIIATRFSGVEVVISERSDPFSRRIPWIWSFACALLYRFASVVVVQTETVKHGILNIYPSLKRVVCIPNPLPAGLSAIQHSQEGRPRRVLLSLGRLVPGKQVDHSIMAFAKVASDRMDWDLHVYGDGPCRCELESLVDELRLGTRVLFKGQTAQPWQVMAQADAFVMTSRNEGFPNALLEAMAVGLPSVVYDCQSGPREISRDGEDAVLVPLNDQGALGQALDRLMGSQDARRELGERGRNSVWRRFDLQVVLQHWDQVFRLAGVRI
jgi:GalNAc-alpha-(1->4)-GalNAc-alpha-(1->3)-diNAcBac-PP-undecaprenol alpha-1,4-N-acetyl-D-galactosaminyltransferase